MAGWGDNQEGQKNHASNRHDDLLADHRAPEGQYGIAGDHVSRPRGNVAIGHRIQIPGLRFDLGHDRDPPFSVCPKRKSIAWGYRALIGAKHQNAEAPARVSPKLPRGGSRTQRQSTVPLVLQGGHAVYILVERVEKPTYKRAAPPLCCRVADADSLETPGAHPATPSHAGASSHRKGEPPKRITRD